MDKIGIGIRSALREHWGIILITALAAAFRFAYLDFDLYRWWHPDYTYPVHLSLQFLENGTLPIISHENPWGKVNPPFMFYLMALPLFIFRSLMAARFFITLLNTLSVPLTYLLALRLFDKKTALSAALIYAITPWAVFYSRAAWEPGLLPLFTALVTYLLFTALTGKGNQNLRMFFALAVTAIMTQSYLLAYVAIAQVALVLLASHRKLNRRPLLWGLIFFVVISFPYTYYILSNSQKMTMTLASYAGPPTVDTKMIEYALAMVSGAGYFPGGQFHLLDFGEKNLLPGWPFTISVGVITLLVAMGIGEGLLRMFRKERTENHALFLIWFATPVALMTIHSNIVHLFPWYPLPTWPAGFVLAGLGARHFWRFRGLPIVLALALMTTFGIHLTQTYLARSEVDDPQRGFQMQELPFHDALAVGQTLGETVRETTKEVYFSFSTDMILVSALSGTLIDPFPHFQEDRFLVLRANHPALYVLFDPQELSPGFAHSHELHQKQIDLPDDRSIRFFLFPSHSKEDLASLPSHPLNLQLDSGWRLLGYDLPSQIRRGGTVQFTTYWLVEDLPSYRERSSLFLKPFAHLIDENGIAVAIGDGHGQAGSLWRRGDFYIDTLQIKIPQNLVSGEYSLLIGLYDPNSSRRALFPNGQDHLLIGPYPIP